MILQLDDARNIITLLDICERDYNFRLLVEKELKLLGVVRNLTKKTRDLISKGVLASIGMSLNYEIEEDHTLEDMIIDKEQSTEDIVMKKIDTEKLFTSLERLPLLLRGVLAHRFGLVGYTPKSYKEIGSIYLLHVDDIKEMEKKALVLLRVYMSDELMVDDYTGAIALLLAISWGREDEC